MKQFSIVDCTLQEGGFINNWSFGKKDIEDIVRKLVCSKVDVIDMGFLKDEPQQRNRSIYNSIDSVFPFINPKKTATLFSISIEMKDPLPISKLQSYSKNGVDIIRIMFEKQMIKEGFEYCTKVKEMGYQIAIQPLRADQYSYKEFGDMLNEFNSISPDIFYIDDNWGVLHSDNIIEYAKIADRFLAASASLACHSQNNLQQSFAVFESLLKEEFTRNIVFDASVYGIGRTSGILADEIIAEYLNEYFKTAYQIGFFYEILDKFICGTNYVKLLGFHDSFYLAAINRINPDYADYYDNQSKLPNSEIDAIFKLISCEDKAKFTIEKAKKYLRQFFKKRWSKKLCIIVPTANRSEAIAYLLAYKSEIYSIYGIDLIVFDSSDDDKTENITKKYTLYEGSTTIYCRYTKSFDGISIDEKIMTSYKTFADKYEYIWICRDGHMINFYNVERELWQILLNKPDSVIVYDQWQNNKGLQKEQEYTDCRQIFKDHCCHMTILGVCIFSSDFIKHVLSEQPLDELKNYCLWQPIAMFAYWGSHQPRVTSYIVPNLFDINYFATTSSFWNKNRRALWQWGERWYTMIDGLPSIYDSEKKSVLQVGMRDFTPFGLKQLIIMRGNGSLSFKSYRENKKYLFSITKRTPREFYFVCFIPQFICRWGLDKYSQVNENIRDRFHYKRLRLYRKLKCRNTEMVPSSLTLGNEKIPKNENLYEVFVTKKQLCIIILTANRSKEIEDNLFTTIELYNSYDVDVVIWDSSSDNAVEKLVQTWIKKKTSRMLHYERFIGKTDPLSIDKQIIASYNNFADQYEYLWILRDRAGINLNVCIIDILQAFKEKKDLICVHNPDDMNICNNSKVQYKDCEELFRKLFTQLTVLGNVIVRSTFIKDVLREVPLDLHKNYGLWQTMAILEYCAKHPFSAEEIISPCAIFHKNCLQGPYWQKFYFWQWFERFYEMLHLLPSIYTNEIYFVLIEFNDRTTLFDPSFLLGLRLKGYLTIEDVEKYKSIIPFVSKTPVEYFEKIAKMNRSQAKFCQSHFMKPKVQNMFNKVDHSQLGDFNCRGNMEEENKDARD